MTSHMVSEQQILDALSRVPADQWPGVLAYLREMESCKDAELDPPIRTAADLAASELAGIWSDRTDIVSGRAFAEALRRQSEQRQGPNGAA